MAISATTRVITAQGRVGVCVYDNAAVTDDQKPSAIVIFNDSTYDQYPRAQLTTQTGSWIPGTGS